MGEIPLKFWDHDQTRNKFSFRHQEDRYGIKHHRIRNKMMGRMNHQGSNQDSSTWISKKTNSKLENYAKRSLWRLGKEGQIRKKENANLR